ncbi:FAD-binding oxidoreductase [Nakamurella endophytica]|uniref:FAD-linked oxidase n=1 Tax=Nakamurella endophytica TaxID=1748367 RepID=A0A917TC98_9ACTN|nr:FAD-binding oxidoreductase [Nakamurella endophytica]GGM18198.1 FAD-linked oxidase [Nakamurella endophytica]
MTAVVDPTDTTALPLTDLDAATAGRVLLPGSAEYDALATPWNVAVPCRPVAVLAATCAADVQAAVRFAGAHGLEVAVQATGHGAVPVPRPFLLVQTALLDELAIRPDATARVGAGVRWSRLLEAAAPSGLAGPAGSAPHVGVVGYLTGGGIGPVARTVGVGSDHVTAFDVVTGDGVLRRATATENPALFWGLRGGKGTLGIVTAVELQLQPLREVFGGCVFFAGEDAASVLHTWRAWTAGLPEQATSSVAVFRMPPLPGIPEPLAGTVTVALRFAWVGDPAQGEAALAPMLGAGRIVLGGMGVLPFAAIGAIHNDPVDPMPTLEASALLRELPVEAVDALLALAGPAAGCPQIMVELRHLGGAVGREPAVAGAFDQRDGQFALMAIGLAVPPVAAAVRAHGGALLDALAPWSTGGCLPNFAASADPAEVARKYGRDTLRRLATLAATYDPHGVLAAARPVRQACLAL